MDDRQYPRQSRVPDAEEEDYFNTDDDDDFVPSISQQWSRGTSSPMPLNPLKRKRRMGIAPLPKGLRPQKASTSIPLVDYADEDEEKSEDAKSSSQTTSWVPVPLSKTEPSLEASSTREIPMTEDIAALLEDYDDLQSEEDDWPPTQPQSGGEAASRRAFKISKQTPSPSLPPARLKRQRNDEDDEDELLERLTKSKRPDLGTQKDAVRGRSKSGDDPPKKFKMKIGKSAPAVSTIPSEAKSGDVG